MMHGAVLLKSVANCFHKAGFLFENAGSNKDVSNNEHWELTALKENPVHENVGIADFVDVDNNLAVTSAVSNESIIVSVDDSEDDDDCTW